MNPLFLWNVPRAWLQQKTQNMMDQPSCFQMERCSFQHILSSFFSKRYYFNCCQFEGSTQLRRTQDSWTWPLLTSSDPYQIFPQTLSSPPLALWASLVTFWSVYLVFSCFVALMLLYSLVFEVSIIWPVPKDDGKRAVTLKGNLGCQQQKCCHMSSFKEDFCFYFCKIAPPRWPTCVFSASVQHTGISELTYPHIRYISSRMTGFGRTYEVSKRLQIWPVTVFQACAMPFGLRPLRLVSCQDLLHLEERLGTVNRGASQGTIERCTYPHKYKKVSRSACSVTRTL